MKSNFSVTPVEYSQIENGSSISAPQQVVNEISDSACGAKHEEAAEGQGKMPDRECTQACVRGGSKYVLVVDGKVFQIANQDRRRLITMFCFRRHHARGLDNLRLESSYGKPRVCSAVVTVHKLDVALFAYMLL